MPISILEAEIILGMLLIEKGGPPKGQGTLGSQELIVEVTNHKRKALGGSFLLTVGFFVACS